MADSINDLETEKGLRKNRRTQPAAANNEKAAAKTPIKRYTEAISSHTPHKVLENLNPTPRRSTRRSVKPINYKETATSKLGSEKRGRKKQRNNKSYEDAEIFEETEEHHTENILEEENLAELGLKPLEPETEQDNVFVINKIEAKENENCEQVLEKPASNTTVKEDMDSLICCDDNDSLEKNNKNDTFNMSDCIIISPTAEGKLDESVAIDLPNNSEKDIEKNTATLMKIPEINIITATPVAGSPSPAKEKRKMPLHPTPYKPKKQKRMRAEKENVEKLEESSSKEPAEQEQQIDINLQGIRKRSFTKTMESNAKKNKNNVTFYSPANQTVIIEAVNISTSKSNEEIAELSEQKESKAQADFITQRRRRSMSLDESLLNNSNKPVTEGTPNKSKLTRTKLPNFAAIHEKQFAKMENLVEHVARKAERAKVLITSSAGKTRPISAQKSDEARSFDKKHGNDKDKVKASRKIELLMASNKTTVKAISQEAEQINLPIIRAPKSPRFISKKDATIETAAAKPKRLPVAINKKIVNQLPQEEISEIRIPVIRPATTTQELERAIPKAPMHKPVKAKIAKPVNKKPFNLSTHLPNPTFALSSTVNFGNHSSAALAGVLSEAKSKNNVSVTDKTAARRQRHMDMFKGRRGRLDAESNETSMKRKQDLIRGVRSNRRFELQMQHRRNLEN